MLPYPVLSFLMACVALQLLPFGGCPCDKAGHLKSSTPAPVSQAVPLGVVHGRDLKTNGIIAKNKTNEVCPWSTVSFLVVCGFWFLWGLVGLFVLGFLCVVVFGFGWAFFFFYYAGSKGSGLAGFFGLT